MRKSIGIWLTIVWAGSSLVAQNSEKPKPAPAPLETTLPGKPTTKPETTPPVKKAPDKAPEKALEPKFASGLVPFSILDNLSKAELEALDNDAHRLEIRDISVKDFFERIKGLHLFSTLVIKDNLGDEMMPVTVIKIKDLKNYIVQLGQYTDAVEVTQTDESAIVVSGKPKPQVKPNILFVPVNLEPLLAGIKGANEREIENNKIEKIKSIQGVIEQGIAFDAEARGLKPAVPLRMMVYPNNLLFLAGQPEQVEVAGKILSALGARFALQDPIMGGWRAVPGGAGMGMPGMEMAPGAMIPGMSGGLRPGSTTTRPYSVPLPGGTDSAISPISGSGTRPKPNPNQALPGLPNSVPSVPPIRDDLPVLPSSGAPTLPGAVGGDPLSGGSGLPVGR